MSSVPEQQTPQAMDPHEGTGWPGDRDWLIALVFFGLAIVLAILFAVYALAWDGGGTT